LEFGSWNLVLSHWNLVFGAWDFPGGAMTCHELVELLIDFVSDELPPEHRQRLEQHLRCCPPCEAYLASYQTTIRLTRQLPCEPIPPQLEQRLRAALQEFRQQQG
jgi:anti-sigma factor RsiW